MSTEGPDDPDATVVIRAPRREPPPASAAAAPPQTPAKEQSAPPPLQGATTGPTVSSRQGSASAPGKRAPVASGVGISGVGPNLAAFRSGNNPLVRAATPLLELTVRLAVLSGHHDVATLHARVSDDISRFADVARNEGAAADQIQHARYAVCALLDDVVLNTGWGSQSVWSTRSMVGQFHRETVGGERFFQLLRELEEDTPRTLDLLELMYLCLSLGFQGQLRRPADGPAQHARIRERVYALLQRFRGSAPTTLSPQWEGVEEPTRRPVRLLPLWLILAVALVLLFALFIGLRVLLNQQQAAVVADLAALPPSGAVEIQHVSVPDPPEIPPPPAPTTLFERLSERLVDDVAADRLAIADLPEKVLITANSADMFPSGSAAPTSSVLPLVDRIAQAILPERNALILIIGHTDSIPIRSAEFADNLDLSLARAEAVRSLLDPRLTSGQQLVAQGEGASNPVASNETAEGRARNRRIEISVLKSGLDDGG